jgi:hypothetical protein
MVALAMLTFASPVVAQTVISTTGGGVPIAPYGKIGVQTFGQTFTSPTDNVLQSVTFYLSPAPSLISRAYVYAWDQILLRASGPALFTSAPIIGPGPIGPGFIPVNVSIGGLVLNPFSSYVAFFSSSGQNTLGEIALQSSWESPAADQYLGGAFVYLNNDENTAAWTTQTWSTNRQGVGSDVRFTMQFATVPEPSSLVLVVTGGVVVAASAFSRRRRRRDDSDLAQDPI